MGSLISGAQKLFSTPKIVPLPLPLTPTIRATIDLEQYYEYYETELLLETARAEIRIATVQSSSTERQYATSENHLEL
jgi:hypothetical protein